jgi:hypothetical protein
VVELAITEVAPVLRDQRRVVELRTTVDGADDDPFTGSGELVPRLRRADPV